MPAWVDSCSGGGWLELNLGRVAPTLRATAGQPRYSLDTPKHSYVGLRYGHHRPHASTGVGALVTNVPRGVFSWWRGELVVVCDLVWSLATPEV